MNRRNKFMRTSLRFRQSQRFVASLLVMGCGVHHSRAQQAAQPKPAVADKPFGILTGDFTIAASRGTDSRTNRKQVLDGNVVVTIHNSKSSFEVHNTAGGLSLGKRFPAFVTATRAPRPPIFVPLGFMRFDTANMKVEFKGKTTIFRDGSGRTLTVKPYLQP
jgi:hypothetical protein